MTETLGANPRLASLLRKLSVISTGLIVALGVLVFAGWIFELPFFIDIQTSFTMKANTSLLFVVLGAGLWLRATGRSPRAMRACAGVIVAVAGLTAGEYVFGWELGLDQLLVRDTTGGVLAPGRMAPATALCFLMIGSALFSNPEKPGRRASDYLVLFAAFVAFLSVCGHLYGAPSLYKIGPYTTMASHTAIGLMIAAASFFGARPEHGLLAPFTVDTDAGGLLRRLLPAIVVLPLVLGWATLRALPTGSYDSSFVIAISTVVTIALLTATVLRIEAPLRAAELARRAGEKKYRDLYEHAPDMYVSVSADSGRLVECNQTVCQVLGYSKEELIGRPVFELCAPDTDYRARDAFRTFLKTGEVNDAELIFVSKRGRALDISLNATAIRDENGRIIRSRSVWRDITARKAAEREHLRTVDALRASEALIAAKLASAFDGIVSTDHRGAIVEFNPAAEKMFGLSRAEALHRPAAELLGEQEIFGETIERMVRRASGAEFPAELAITRVEGQDPPILTTFIRDVSARKLMEAELSAQKATAEKLQERGRFFELSVDMVCIADVRGRFLELNPMFSVTLGYSTEYLLARPLFELIHRDDLEATEREIQKLAAGATAVDFTNRVRRADGSYRWLQWRSTPEGEGTFYAVARDVTRDRQLVEELRVLLQEVHHRVKNNLQVISSLINMQLRKLADSPSRVALEECRNRVAAIALIHESLHQAKDYSRVPFSEYAQSLARNIFHVAGTSPNNVKLFVDIESTMLTVDKAVPCGLILNELMTNALNHAFPEDRKGSIHVELKKNGDDRLRLTVRDDGVGLPELPGEDRRDSLGMVLVSALVRQLDGELEIIRDQGTRFHVRFPVETTI